MLAVTSGLRLCWFNPPPALDVLAASQKALHGSSATAGPAEALHGLLCALQRSFPPDLSHCRQLHTDLGNRGLTFCNPMNAMLSLSLQMLPQYSGAWSPFCPSQDFRIVVHWGDMKFQQQQCNSKSIQTHIQHPSESQVMKAPSCARQCKAHPVPWGKKAVTSTVARSLDPEGSCPASNQ